MSTMKAVRIDEFGGPEVLRIEEVPVPQPAEDEVLLRVHAAGVNPVDIKTREGAFAPVGRGALPVTLGRDVSGVVESCGTRAKPLEEGDALFAFLGTDRGGFAEYVVVKATEAAPKPGQLSHIEAAAVPLAALTAWQGLFDHGGLSAGQRVLIHGGGGGVGHFAVQFARECGATVLATASPADLDFVRRLGADEAIDYKAERFEERTGDIDLVFDLVGGDTQDRSWSVLKPGGILVSTLGPPPQEKAEAHKARAAGYMASPDAAQLAEIGRLIEDGKIGPAVDSVFGFDAAVTAERELERRHVQGKIVLDLAV